MRATTDSGWTVAGAEVAAAGDRVRLGHARDHDPEPGGPDVLIWAEVPDPEPGPGEVVVDVRASAVNRADLLQRQGHYPPPPGAPAYPGLECSGVIGAIGPDVTGWAGRATRSARCWPAAGTPSGWRCRPGSCCRCRPASTWSTPPRCPRWPARSGRTWSRWPRLRRGRDAAGARRRQRHRHVRDPARRGARRDRGGHRPGGQARAAARAGRRRASIDYRQQDFVEEVRRVTDGRGADVILDIMGASYLGRNVDALATGGRLVVIGMQGGRKAELDLGALLAKRARSRPPRCAPGRWRRRPRSSGGYASRSGRWSRPGRIRPVIDRRLPMAEAAQAHRLVESNDHVGKVLLTVG